MYIYCAHYSKNFFNKYRDLSADAVRPAKFSDCARIYRECAAAEEYNDVDDGELEAVKPITPPAADEATIDDIVDNEVIEYDGGDAKPAAVEAAERSFPSSDDGRLILLRADQ